MCLFNISNFFAVFPEKQRHLINYTPKRRRQCELMGTFLELYKATQKTECKIFGPAKEKNRKHTVTV